MVNNAGGKNRFEETPADDDRGEIFASFVSAKLHWLSFISKMAVFVASNNFSISNCHEYSSFLERYKQQNSRADLFGALIARTFSSETISYSLADFSLSIPSIYFDQNSVSADPNERPEIFSLHGSVQKDASAIKKEEKRVADVADVAEVDFNSDTNVLMNESELQRCLLLGLLGIESNILYLSSLPNHGILGNSSFGVAQTVVLGVVMKFREIFIHRLLLISFCSAFHSSAYPLVSPSCEAFITAIKLILHIVDTSILFIMQKYEVREQEDDLNEDFVQFWECTASHRQMIFQLVRMVSPPELLYVLNKSQTKQKSYIDVVNIGLYISANVHRPWEKTLSMYFSAAPWIQYYGTEGPFCNGWAILERLLIYFARNRTIPCVDIPLELKIERYSSRLRTASESHQQDQRDSTLMDIDMCLVTMTCQLVKSVSEPLLQDVCSKLYNIQLKQQSRTGFFRHRPEYLLSMSIETIWDAVDHPHHPIRSNNRQSSVLIEQLLAACVWVDGRIAILHSEEVAVEDEQPTRKVPLSIDAQRKSIRDQLIQPFQDVVSTLSIPVTEEEEIAWTKVRIKSAAIIHVFRKNLTVLMNEWATPSCTTRNPVVKEKSVLDDDDSAELLHISTISEEDRSLHIAPLGNAEKNVQVEQPNAEQLIVEEDEHDGKDLKSGDSSRRLLTSFYTSPLNIERTVETYLVSAAKDRLTLKYDALMNDLERRSAKAVWQVKRLKAVNQARRELRQLREKEFTLLSKEKAIRRPPGERKQGLDTLYELDDDGDGDDSEGREELELSNESQFIIAPEPVPIENEIVEEKGTPDVMNPPFLFFQRTKAESDSAKSLIYGTTDTVVSSLVPSVKVAQDPGGNSSIILSHEVELVGAPNVPKLFSADEEFFSAASILDSRSYKSAVSEGLVPECLLETGDNSDVASVSSSDNKGLVVVVDGNMESDNDVIRDEEEPLMMDESLPEIPIDIDAHFSESLQRRRSSYQESSFESQYGSMVDNMLNPDLVYLEQEETARDALTSLPRAFSLMAISLGIVEWNSEGDAPLVESSLSLKPFSAMMHESVGAAVKLQCAAVNLAALYSLVAASDLLGHLDSIERLFLISPKSDFLTTISATIVDRFLEQNKLFKTDHIDIENPRRRAQNKAIPCLWQNEILSTIDTADGLHGSYQRLWSPWRIQEAIGVASSRSNINSVNTKYIHMARFHIDVPNTQTSSPSLAAYDPMNELCSMQGLQFLKLEYLTDWPIPAIITPVILDRIGSMTRRLLELSHLNELLRITWAQLRVRQQFSQRVMAKDGNRGKSFRLLDREINGCFRILQTTVQGLLNYVSDRVHSSSQRLRNRMVRSAYHGLDEAVSAIEEYAHCLQTASFMPTSGDEQELVGKYIAYEEDEDSDLQRRIVDHAILFKVRFSRLLITCRESLKSFLDFCNCYSTADIGEEKVVQFLAVIVESSNRLQYTKRQLADEDYTKLLIPEERMNADILAMYLLS